MPINSDMDDEERGSALNEGLASIQVHKVIVKIGSGAIVKGYVELSGGVDKGSLFNHSDGLGSTIIVRSFGSKTLIEMPLRDIKSVFFVKSFRGNPNRKGVRFYSNGPAVGSIWAEIRFKDTEVLEGLIENSAQHLIGDGFWVEPSDQGGNNLVVYVNKAAIESYRVLGVRPHRDPDK